MINKTTLLCSVLCLLSSSLYAQGVFSTREAINFAFEKAGVPKTETVRLAFAEAVYGSRGKSWELKFGDGDQVYCVEIQMMDNSN